MANEVFRDIEAVNKVLDIATDKSEDIGAAIKVHVADSIKKSISEVERLNKELEDAANAFKKGGTEQDMIKIAERMAIITKEIKAAEEAQKAWNILLSGTEKTVAGIGNHFGQMGVDVVKLGASLLTGVGALKAAADLAVNVGSAIFKWYEHSALVNKEIYNINANMGHMGSFSRQFEGTISDVAGTFKELPDSVRKTVNSLASMGITTDEMAQTTENLYILYKQFPEITPEKQMETMSKYMKEFGMSTKDAWANMFMVYKTAQDLKEIYPALDQKRFVEQTNDLAIAMRKFGLETSDAVALMTTLGRLGVEQARMGELAQGLAGIGMETPATTYLMTEKFLLPKMRKELAPLEAQLKEGKTPLTTEEQFKYETLRGAVYGGPMGVLGAPAAAATLGMGREVAESKIDYLNLMTKGLLGKTIEAGTIAPTVGLLSNFGAQLGINIGGPEAVREMAERLQRQRIEGGASFDLKSALAEEIAKLKPETMESIAKSQLKQAERAARDTTSINDSVKVIEGLLGNWAAKNFLRGTKMEESEFEETKKKIRGLSAESPTGWLSTTQVAKAVGGQRGYMSEEQYKEIEDERSYGADARSKREFQLEMALGGGANKLRKAVNEQIKGMRSLAAMQMEEHPEMAGSIAKREELAEQDLIKSFSYALQQAYSISPQEITITFNGNAGELFTAVKKVTPGAVAGGPH